LRIEFRDRVGRGRPLLLFERLSDALSSFAVPISAEEKEAEQLLATSISSSSPIYGLQPYGAVPQYMRSPFGNSSVYRSPIYGGNYYASFEPVGQTSVEDLLKWADADDKDSDKKEE